jgi:alkylation response protein AidB-like acyl-CoA dehydrogenase
MALAEPGGGSDLQNLTTSARLDVDTYVINGSKTWISNARRSGLIALLCKIQVASRALGVGQAAFDDALRYAQEQGSHRMPTSSALSRAQH